MGSDDNSAAKALAQSPASSTFRVLKPAADFEPPWLRVQPFTAVLLVNCGRVTHTAGMHRTTRLVGPQVIKQQIADGVEKRRIGLISKGPPARQHSEIQNDEGETVGEITSGAYSPTLKKNVAMGYVTKPYRKAGTKLKARRHCHCHILHNSLCFLRLHKEFIAHLILQGNTSTLVTHQSHAASGTCLGTVLICPTGVATQVVMSLCGAGCRWWCEASLRTRR